jgi:hypothetical protein
MTPDQLSAIRARLDAATPGPWESDYTFVQDNSLGVRIIGVRVSGPAIAYDAGLPDEEVDTQLHATLDVIANAPTDLRALLDEVERLTAERDRLHVDAHFAGIRAHNAERREKARIRERDAAFRRGAEAMRTALLQFISWGSDLADRIRAEPVSEDK